MTIEINIKEYFRTIKKLKYKMGHINKRLGAFMYLIPSFSQVQ